MSEPDPLFSTSAVHGIPPDARRLGVDRNTEQGALLALSGSLDPAKRSHRVAAWVLLVALAGPGFVAAVSLLAGRA